ncbi:MAG: T9SS type A sorting domain-containing protein, partial [Gemmatimonadota bacterium]|nr:T9SS type A sorting domain-containing protein [Gemmatimonadota bacterium]
GTNTKFTQGTFMVGFLLEAFINYYFIEEDERVVDFVRQAVDWMSANETKKYSNMSFGIGFLAAELEDEDYLELMESYTSSWKSSWSNAFKDYALHGRSMARALYYMSYEGLGQEPPLPPEPDKGDINQDGSLDIADVISLILKGLADPDDTEADFNGDGIYSILDAVSLLIYIRSSGIAATSLLASSEAGARQEIPLLGLEEKGKLLQELDKLKLTVTEWEMIHMALGLPGLPVAFSLGQNHPNPFNPSTTISYAVPEGPPVKVRLDVYNLRGLPVRTLVDNVTDPGYYNVLWDGTDDGGRKQPSGVYFYRLKAGKYTALRKMVLLK